jgi:hypothetical protein
MPPALHENPGQKDESEPLGSSSYNLYGVPVICSSTRKKATIGGIVRVAGKMYGLTVGHLFVNSASATTAGDVDLTSPLQSGDPEFAFYRDEEEENGFDSGDVAATSSGIVVLSQIEPN